MSNTTYESISQMLSAFGCASIAQFARAIYKNTDCGASLSFRLGNGDKIHSGDISEYQNSPEFAARNICGIQIHSICEGSDAEFSSKVLFFPMEGSDFQDAIDQIEAEVNEHWHEIND